MSSFAKYRTRGAYHWQAFARNPFKLDLFTRTRYDAVVNLAQIAPGEVVVDLGCGDGALTWYLSQNNSTGTTIGVEPEEEGRRLAELHSRKANAPLKIMASSVALADQSVDLVICAEVIEHVESPVMLMAEIRRILKPGGRAVISTPVRLSERPYDCEHVQEFFPNEFAAIVQKSLGVEHQVYSMSVFAISFYRWCPAIFLHRGLLRLFINVLFCMTGWNFVEVAKAGNDYWITQLILARKPA